MALARCHPGDFDFSPEPVLAMAARFYFAAIPPAHPRARCAHRPDERFFAGPIDAYFFRPAGGTVRVVFLFLELRRTPIQGAGVDVCSAIRSFRFGKRSRLLHGGGVSDFVCGRSGFAGRMAHLSGAAMAYADRRHRMGGTSGEHHPFRYSLSADRAGEFTMVASNGCNK